MHVEEEHLILFVCQAIVGRSAHSEWKDAAETLTALAITHDIEMNKHVYFDEPYIHDTNVMPAIIEQTYRNTRSK